MMNRVLCIGIAVAAWLLPGDAVGTNGKIAVGPMAGLALPTGNLGDISDLGFVIGGTGEFSLSPTFSVGANGFYGPFKIKSDLTGDPSFDIIEGGIHGRVLFAPEAKLSFFVTGGPGMYHMSASRRQVVSQPDPRVVKVEESETKLGLNVGGGVLVPIDSANKLAIEAKIHVISARDLNNGDDVTFFQVGGTVLFAL